MRAHGDPATGAPHDGTRDLERAIADLAERLPEPLRPLAPLAFDYRWTWLPGAAALFRDLDPMLWQHCGANPRWAIEAAPPRRLRQLAADAAYLGRLAAVRAAFEREAPARRRGAEHGIAYLCSEFAVHCSLPLYSGGLGALAGDVLKAASDLGLSLVGVGLLYRQGYFHQRLDASGWQQESWTTTDVARLPAVRVTGPLGDPLRVGVEIRGRTVFVQAWRVQVGGVALYLLDTDCDGNQAVDRWITARLYIGDRATRLAQYAVLGIGGMRMLQAMGIHAGLVHLNEGHGALASLERIRAAVAHGATPEHALAEVRQRTVFTTHTPVAAGNEWYAPAEVAAVLGEFVNELGSAAPLFHQLGRITPEDDHASVGTTVLALRTSRAAIGVSRRHGAVARGMWRDVWPGLAAEAVPIGHVSNGVHTTTWMAAPMQELLDAHLAADWRERLADAPLWRRLHELPDALLWNVRCRLRSALVDLVRERSVVDRLARGEPSDYVEAAARVFDARVLTIGFARRVATYKRLHLLTRRLERALALLGDDARPIQVVIAGKAHPSDREAKQTLQSLLALRHTAHVGSRIVFLEDYDLHLAPRIVAGVDLWLNLPRPPLEASGTSGMKVAANGGLNLSVLDGWWEEAYEPGLGWAIATPDLDEAAQDDHDAEAFFDLVQGEVVPLFYERDADGLPRYWLQRVKASMAALIPRYSAERMLHESVEALYRPLMPPLP